MSYGKRPGGLTALAVINFVLGGIYMLLALAALAGLAFLSSDMGGQEMDQARRDMEAAGGMAMIVFGCALLVLWSLLLVVSGVGYLKQKPFLGRGLGNTYAVLSIILSSIEIALSEQTFTLVYVVSFIYPVLTLILLNTTFRDDFREERELEDEKPETEGLMA